MVITTYDLSFFLSWGSKIQPNHWTKLMMYIVCFVCVCFFSSSFVSFLCSEEALSWWYCA